MEYKRNSRGTLNRKEIGLEHLLSDLINQVSHIDDLDEKNRCSKPYKKRTT